MITTTATTALAERLRELRDLEDQAAVARMAEALAGHHDLADDDALDVLRDLPSAATDPEAFGGVPGTPGARRWPPELVDRLGRRAIAAARAGAA